MMVCIKATATLLTSLWLMDTSSGYIANSPLFNSLSGPFEPSPTLTRHHQLYAKVKAAGQSDQQQVNNYLDVSSSHHPSNPSFITVDAAVSPLSIIFRSSSSFLRVQQLHHGAPGHLQETSSTDEPIIHRHMIVKPILLQIHEIISPSRRIIQKILPVTEKIETIFARGRATDERPSTEDESSRTSKPSVSYHGNEPDYSFADNEALSSTLQHTILYRHYPIL